MDEKKEMLKGYFWDGGGRSGFVGRIVKKIDPPHHEDCERANRLAQTWALLFRIQSRAGQ